MAPAPDEATGINNFATAFENYFAQATCNAVAVTPGSLAACTAALKAAMVGVASAGAAKIAAGISAFWGVVATNAPTIWVTVPVLISATPPTLLSGLQAAIDAAGAANIAGNKSLVDSADAMATAIHGKQSGGLGNIVIPPGGTYPIL